MYFDQYIVDFHYTWKMAQTVTAHDPVYLCFVILRLRHTLLSSDNSCCFFFFVFFVLFFFFFFFSCFLASLFDCTL